MLYISIEFCPCISKPAFSFCIMSDRFSDKIIFRKFTLIEAQEIARYNFKFQKTVEYLDLSANENQLTFFQPIFNEESMLMTVIPERKILYNLHLDLPRNLGTFCCKNRTRVDKWGEGFHLKEIHISNSVYNRRLERYIVECIENVRDKIEKIRSYMKIFKFLNFSESDNATLYLCDHILSMLYAENCTDSELLRDFLTMFDFSLWVHRVEMPNIFEYVVLQAQIWHCTTDVWRFLVPGIDPVNFCFFRHKIHYMLLLFKYGIITSIPSNFSFEKYIHPLLKITHRLIRRSSKDKRRAFFLFQLWYDFRYHRSSPEGLRCLWSSINDCFLSRTEIKSTFLKYGPIFAKELFEHYQKVIGKDCHSRLSPRTLKALCRVQVRRSMSFNQQLPFGVYGLEIPEDLKLYLNLYL